MAHIVFLVGSTNSDRKCKVQLGHGSLYTLLFTMQMAKSAIFEEQGPSSEHPED
ncbi:hypothetical protein STEG23_030017, partial [Scotinomys teguina]